MKKVDHHDLPFLLTCGFLKIKMQHEALLSKYSNYK